MKHGHRNFLKWHIRRMTNVAKIARVSWATRDLDWSDRGHNGRTPMNKILKFWICLPVNFRILGLRSRGHYLVV
jgi:hypothetical protein